MTGYRKEMLPTFSVGRVIVTVVVEPVIVTVAVELVTVPIVELSLMIIRRMLTEVDERGTSFNWVPRSVPDRPIIVVTGGLFAAMLAVLTAT